MSAALDRFRVPFSYACFQNTDDLEELIPSYPQTLTRPLQLKAILPQDNFLLCSQEKIQKKPKESKSKVPNFSGLKGRRNQNNANQFTNTDSKEQFHEMKSSPLLRFFDRLLRLITTRKIKKRSPRVSPKLSNPRHNRLQEDAFDGIDNNALN